MTNSLVVFYLHCSKNTKKNYKKFLRARQAWLLFNFLNSKYRGIIIEFQYKNYTIIPKSKPKTILY